MRRGLIGSVCTALVLTAAPASAATHAGGLSARDAIAAPRTLARVSVSPGSGGPHTAFRLRFRAPSATGVLGSIVRRDAVVLATPRHRGCVGDTTVPVHTAAAGVQVQVMLRPRRLGGRWCVGDYAGQVIETEEPVCGPPPTGAQACPEIAFPLRTIGRFELRITGG